MRESRGKHVLQYLCAVAIISLFATGLAMAQVVNGTLLGTVKDQQGGAVSGAAVKITETQTNISRTATTNASGNYTFASLQDGVYKVEAELTGFKRVTRDAVVVKVNTTIRVDLALPVGNMTETVEVVQETPVLQTDRADTGRLIESMQLTQLPLANNRNFQNALNWTPGATRTTRPHSEFFNPQDSVESKVNGQSRFSNNFQIDGVDDNQKTGLLQVLIPSADSIDSVSITTSAFDAEFGRAGGAVTSVTLKSGTNQFKGSAFFFGNNDATQASDYFTGKKAPTSYKQFGATLGGPLAKDKLFFFADFQRTADHRGDVFRSTIPPLAWRTGDFSSSTTDIYDPLTGNPDGTGRVKFANKQIPPDRISPIAKAILAQIAAPNIAGAGFGQANYDWTSTRVKNIDAFNVKLNYTPTQKDNFSVRLSYQRPTISDLSAYGIIGGLKDFSATGYQNTYGAALNWTRTLNATTILDVRAGLSYYHNEALSQGSGQNTAQEVGIPGANLDLFSSGMSRIEINGLTNPVVGFATSLPWDRSENTTMVAGTLTKLAGNHTIKFGLEGRHNRDFLLQLQDNGGVRGRFSFNGAQTSIPTDAKAIASPANAFAAFLLDAPNLVSRDIKVIDTPGTKHYEFSTFISDKWQVSRHLTVDLGLRWEYYTPLVGIVDQGGLSNYDPTANTVRVAGYGSIPQNVGVQKNLNNFAPRLGMVYRLNEQTVLRGGFGTSIIPFPDNRYAFNFPVKQNNQYNPPNNFATAGSMKAGFPAASYLPIPDNGIVDASISQLKSAGLFYVPSDLKEAKIHSWNVALQRQLFWKLVAEVAYVGNVGRGILSDYDINAAMTPGLGTAGQPYNAKYGRTASIRTWWPTNTSYNSLQAKLDRRFSNGLLITTSYTYGRAYDYTDDNGTGGAVSTPAAYDKSHGLTGFDRTHMFRATFVWDLPWLKDKRDLAGRVLGGWQLSAAAAADSGQPLNITMSNALLAAPSNTQFPDLVGTQTVLGNIGPGQKYFDTSVYANPAAKTFGNMSRNQGPRGPGFFGLDASLVKRLRFGEKVRFELRADAFNVLNHPNFANPNTTFGSPTFGEISAYYSAGQFAGLPRVIRFGTRLSF